MGVGRAAHPSGVEGGRRPQPEGDLKMFNIYLTVQFIKDVCIILLCILVLGYVTGRTDREFTPSRTAFIEEQTCHTDTECEEQEDYLNAHNIYRM